MSKIKRALALVTFGALNVFVWSPPVLALDPSLDVRQYAHTAWTVRGGFFEGLISTITQTPSGYLWFGTEHGLVRFDGVTRVEWQPPVGERLPSKYIKSLLVARDGTLWIGTFEGLVSWNRSKLTHYPQMSGFVIGALLEDDAGTIWAGGEAAPRGRLCAIRRDGVECYGQDGSLGYAVMSLYLDHHRNLWVGATTGLWHWRPGLPRRYSGTGIIDRSQGLIEDDRGVLLAASHDGIRQVVNDKAEPYRLAGRDQRVRQAKFLRDRDGGFWIGTSNEGVFHLHQGRMDVFNRFNGLSGNNVTCLFEDSEGDVWVATLDGADRFRDVAIPTYSVAQGLSSPVAVSVVGARDSSVWLGTIDGLNRWKAGQITRFHKPATPSLPQAVAAGPVRNISARGLPDDNIQSLYEDHRGRIWVSTPRGIAWFENGNFHPITLATGGRVSSITGDSAGNVWISAVPGLTHLVDLRVVQQIPWTAFGDRGLAYSLITGRDASELWLGFYKGGVAWFKDGQVRQLFTEAHGLGRGHVSALYFDGENALWAATEGGVSRLKDGRLATLTHKNGLPCETVLWVMQDDKQDFWFYTECGLVRISRAELKAWSIDSKRVVETTVFDVSEGVRSRSKASDYEPRVAKSRDGKLWFLPLDGVSVADPERLTRRPFNKMAPPVHIERVRADDKSYEPRTGLRLPAHVRDVSIDYTALSLAVPERVRFRYKLEGQDPEWKEVINERQAPYTNLAPGQYRFHVIACNYSGVWNETGDTLVFSVAPAYYQTNWFIALCIAAFSAMLWGLFRLRVYQIRREFNAQLDGRVDERMRIARELHDTLLQSVQGLMYSFQAARNLLPGRIEEAIRTLDVAIREGDGAVAEGRDAIQGLRGNPALDSNLEHLLTAAGKELARSSSAEGEAPAFQVTVEGARRPLSPLLQDEVYRIAREILRNAFHHAHASRIEAEITYDGRFFRLRIRDNGKGIDRKVLEAGVRQGHWGLPGVRERAERIGARLRVWSEPGAGTEAELAVPARIAY